MRFANTVLAFVVLVHHVAAQQAGNVLPSTTVTLSPLAYYDPGGGQKPVGTCRPMTITVGGLPAGQTRVGVFESMLEGTGHLWRATIWQASLTAAQVLDFDQRAMQVAASVEGRIDGPSAGALFTMGILAAVRGDTINNEVTMTGTINPDGTVGPVGGIPYKLEGAAAAGKKVVLIPGTSRFEYDSHTEKFIDLPEHGKSLGLTVHRVNDIWEVYEHFTGKSLPRHKQAKVPEVSLAQSERIRKFTANWVQLQAKAQTAYDSWSEDYHSDYSDEIMDESKELLKRSLSLTVEGEFAAAYWDAVMSAAYAWDAYQVGRCMHAISQSADGVEGARRLLQDESWVDKEFDPTAAAMRYFRPTNLTQVAIYMGGCEAFYEGLCYRTLAQKMGTLKFEDEDLTSDAVITAAEQLVITWLDMILARDCLELADSYQGAPLSTDAPVMDLANFYEQCAVAGLAVVDELEVKTVGEKYGLAMEQAREELMLRDPDYAAARLAASDVLPKLNTYYGEGPQYGYARLAATSSLHTWSAMLIAKYYSLGVEADEYYNITGIRSEKVLTEWLDDSRDQASRAIGSLVDAKIDPTTCIQTYSIARMSEGRGELHRLDALEDYFRVNVTAQVLRRLAGVKGFAR
jgi:hypothetical protein